MIFADPSAIHGSRTFQGAISDVDGVLVDSPHFRGDEQALAGAGADLVVRTLDEVSRPALAEGRLARKTEG